MNGEIPIKEIPQKVMDDVMVVLKNYLVALYTVLREKDQIRPRPIGSGTFVEIEGVHYILTAAHVWREARKEEEIGLVLTDHQSSFKIPRDRIDAKPLWDGNLSEGWGADLALLRLAPTDIGTIKAHKSFLNLPRQKAALVEYPPVIEEGLWAVTGMIGQFTEVYQKPEAKAVECYINGEAAISVVLQTHEHDGYDYFDLVANLEIPGTPTSFAGLSGGGL